MLKNRDAYINRGLPEYVADKCIPFYCTDAAYEGKGRFFKDLARFFNIFSFEEWIDNVTRDCYNVETYCESLDIPDSPTKWVAFGYSGYDG